MKIRLATSADADALARVLADQLRESYDMHWASYGAQVADFYVAPAYRGRGLALELVAHLAAAVRDAGGAFIRGGAYDRPSTPRFYARIAVVMASGETHLGGRALRHRAGMAGQPARTILGQLPPIDWNYEP